jgi:hypothetical protein
MRALELLRGLVDVDPRYNLSVYGKSASQVHWIQGESAQREYFKLCDDYVHQHGLENHVAYKGHVDVTTELADVGYVLSVSDDEYLPESFHIAPADGFAAGGQGAFLRWSGVEYIYPRDYVFESLEDMRDHIVSESRDYKLFSRSSRAGREFIRANYSPGLFLMRLGNIIRELL